MKTATAFRPQCLERTMHINYMGLYKKVCLGHWLPNIQQLIIPY